MRGLDGCFAAAPPLLRISNCGTNLLLGVVRKLLKNRFCVIRIAIHESPNARDPSQMK